MVFEKSILHPNNSMFFPLPLSVLYSPCWCCWPGCFATSPQRASWPEQPVWSTHASCRPTPSIASLYWIGICTRTETHTNWDRWTLKIQNGCIHRRTSRSVYTGQTNPIAEEWMAGPDTDKGYSLICVRCQVFLLFLLLSSEQWYNILHK